MYLFLPCFSLPHNILLICFDTALWELPIFFAITFLRLSLLMEGANDVFLHNCKVSSLSHDCDSYLTRLRDCVKAQQPFEGVMA